MIDFNALIEQEARQRLANMSRNELESLIKEVQKERMLKKKNNW
jgi:hypothetical protein